MPEWNRYGPTAARAGGLGRRPAGGPIIDVHAHVLVPEAEAFAQRHIDPAKNPSIRFASETTRALNRSQESERRSQLTQHEERLRDMDEMGVEMQIVSPSPPQCYPDLAAEAAVPAIRMVNDGIAAFAARYPDRFAALGTVPLQDVGSAIAELDRCIATLGCKGIEVLTHAGGRELSDPQFEPFWARAAATGALVMIHPLGFSGGERLARYYFNNVIGNPLETTIAIHHLIFDGVLERHPKLKILAVHGGGFAAAYAGRMDHAWGARSDARGTLPHPPTSYLKKFYFDTVVFTPHQLDALVGLFGSERLLLGTDYPFDMGEYDPLAHLASAESLDDSAHARIAGGNAKRLLKI